MVIDQDRQFALACVASLICYFVQDLRSGNTDDWVRPYTTIVW